jgi:hypothetical protein
MEDMVWLLAEVRTHQDFNSSLQQMEDMVWLLAEVRTHQNS